MTISLGIEKATQCSMGITPRWPNQWLAVFPLKALKNPLLAT